jgi:hypothetical protein
LHQATGDDFAFNNLVLEFLDRDCVEISMRERVITQNYSSVNPLLEQGYPRLHFACCLQLAFVDEGDGGNAIRLQYADDLFCGALSVRQTPLFDCNKGQIIEGHRHAS